MYSRGDGYGDRPRHQFVLWSCMGVVVVSVCLSGAVIRGGRGGAACLSYRVCGCRRASGHAWLSLFAARVGAVVVGLVVQP